MKQVKGNIWDFHRVGYWVIIPTNGNIKKNGEAVMGKGLALEAKKKFPRLPKQLAERLESYGDSVHIFAEYRIVTFPTKKNWWKKASPALIAKSAKELAFLMLDEPIYIPHVGCANGGRQWSEIAPILQKYLGDDFIAIEYNK